MMRWENTMEHMRMVYRVMSKCVMVLGTFNRVFLVLVLLVAVTFPSFADQGSNRIGQALSPIQQGSGSESNLEGLLRIAIENKLPAGPKVTDVTILAESDTAIKLQLSLTGKAGKLLVALLDGSGRAIQHVQRKSVSVKDDTKSVEIEFSLPSNMPEGVIVTSQQLQIKSILLGRKIPGAVWHFELAKVWEKTRLPENVVVSITPKPIGAARSLGKPKPSSGGFQIKPVQMMVLNKPLQKQSVKKISANKNKSVYTRGLSKPVFTSTGQKLKKTTKKTASTGSKTVSAKHVGNQVFYQKQPSTAFNNKMVLMKTTKRAVELLPNKNFKFVSGLKPEEKNRGAQGPSDQTIDLLDGLQGSNEITMNDRDVLGNIGRYVYQDKNPESGVLYYLSRSYHLDWNKNDGYALRMLYTASADEDEAGEVLMAMRLNSGIDSSDQRLVRDLVNAYKARYPSLKVSKVRPLPVTSGHPDVSLADDLGRHFNIPTDKVVANIVSDSLGQMDVSWVTDETTKENIELVLTEGIGINGTVEFNLESADVGAVAIPADIKIASRGTFGEMRWRRGVDWRNDTPYPVRLKYLHALVIKGNKPTLYSWDLHDTKVSSLSKAKFDSRYVHSSIDNQAKRLWMDYEVMADCDSCNRSVIKSITSGATQTGSREEISLRSLTPFADTGAIEIGIRLRSNYFHPSDRDKKVSQQYILTGDGEEISGGKVYLVDRQLGEERPDDPLFEYQLELVMPDGMLHTANNWLPGNAVRVRIGSHQVKQAFGSLPQYPLPEDNDDANADDVDSKDSNDLQDSTDSQSEEPNE